MLKLPICFKENNARDTLQAMEMQLWINHGDSGNIRRCKLVFPAKLSYSHVIIKQTNKLSCIHFTLII